MRLNNLGDLLGSRTGNRLVWILIIGSGMLLAFAPLPGLSHSSPQSRSIRIEANQFAYLPGQFHVNPGDLVTIELVSTDVVHGLYVDGYDLSVQSDPGQPAYLTFTADKTGSFRFRCNVTCGALHPFMIGKITVGVNHWLYRGSGLAFLFVVGMLTSMHGWKRTNTLNTKSILQK
jgi:heme/copper-type cytochrome/quinol oxidase subunit 2